MNSKLNIRIDTLIDAVESNTLHKKILSVLSASEPESMVDRNYELIVDFTGVGNYTNNEIFEIQNGLLWRSEPKNGGWWNSGFDFVPWSGDASINLHGSQFKLNFYKGKLQSVR